MTRRKSKSKKKWCNNGPAAPLDKKKGSSPPFPQGGYSATFHWGNPAPRSNSAYSCIFHSLIEKVPLSSVPSIELKIAPLSLWSSSQQLFSSYYGEFDADIRCVSLYYFREVEEETSRHPGYPFIHLNEFTKFLPVYRQQAWLKEPLFGRRLPVSVSIDHHKEQDPIWAPVRRLANDGLGSLARRGLESGFFVASLSLLTCAIDSFRQRTIRHWEFKLLLSK